MAFNFNAEEVFRIGERIEDNGEKFYRAAAAATDDLKLRGALADLARQESVHQIRFRQLREALGNESGKPTVFDPNDEAVMYLEATANTHVFTGEYNAADEFSGLAEAKDILRRALRFEKDSIVFFRAMKEVTPAGLGGDSIDWLIAEEMKHVRQINEMMKQY